eukprot:355657-Chlamydomonas_euryale.AAC.3
MSGYSGGVPASRAGEGLATCRRRGRGGRRGGESIRLGMQGVAGLGKLKGSMFFNRPPARPPSHIPPPQLIPVAMQPVDTPRQLEPFHKQCDWRSQRANALLLVQLHRRFRTQQVPRLQPPNHTLFKRANTHTTINTATCANTDATTHTVAGRGLRATGRVLDAVHAAAADTHATATQAGASCAPFLSRADLVAGVPHGGADSHAGHARSAAAAALLAALVMTSDAGAARAALAPAPVPAAPPAPPAAAEAVSSVGDCYGLSSEGTAALATQAQSAAPDVAAQGLQADIKWPNGGTWRYSDFLEVQCGRVGCLPECLSAVWKGGGEKMRRRRGGKGKGEYGAWYVWQACKRTGDGCNTCAW